MAAGHTTKATKDVHPQEWAAFQVLQGSRVHVAAPRAHIRGLIPLNAFHLERPRDSRAHKVLGNHLFVFFWPHQWMKAGKGRHGLPEGSDILPQHHQLFL